MEIILKIIGLFVAFVLVVIAFKIALFLIGASLIPGLIVGGLSYWIFDAFCPGFMVGGAIGIVFGIIGQFSSNNASSSNSNGSGCSYPHPRNESYPTSREGRSNRNSDNNSDKQNYIEGLKWNYNNEIDHSNECKSKAQYNYDQADTEERYAENYERQYNEYQDEDYKTQADRCYSNADYYRREGDQWRSEAERHYNQAQGYKRDLEAEGIYL